MQVYLQAGRGALGGGLAYGEYLQVKHEEAHDFHQRALAIFEKALGPDHPNVAHALVGLGETLVARDEPTAASTHLERALTIRTTHDVGRADLAEARLALARALWSAPAAQGRDRARTLAEQARNAYATLGDSQKTKLTEVQAWLAEHRLP